MRILKTLGLRRPALDRRDVTRAEFNHLVALVKERGDVVDRLTKDLEIQLRRMAQMQLELDEVRLAWQRSKRTQSLGPKARTEPPFPCSLRRERGTHPGIAYPPFRPPEHRDCGEVKVFLRDSCSREWVSGLRWRSTCPRKSSHRRRRSTVCSSRRRRECSACPAARSTIAFGRAGSGRCARDVDRSASCSSRSKG